MSDTGIYVNDNFSSRIYESQLVKDSELLEPREFFENLKSKVQVTERQWLLNQIAVMSDEYDKAKKMNQTRLMHKIRFSLEVASKELALIPLGFTTYTYLHEVNKFIENVRPRNSVLVCDLEDFSRSIPKVPADLIQKAQGAELFDKFIVVYTDFSSEKKVRSEDEQRMVDSNRDPIVFGLFVDRFKAENGNITRDIVERHERLYLIASWEDEYCDLTFSEYVRRAGEDVEHHLSEDTIMERYDRIFSDDFKPKKVHVDSTGKKVSDDTDEGSGNSYEREGWWRYIRNTLANL